MCGYFVYRLIVNRIVVFVADDDEGDCIVVDVNGVHIVLVNDDDDDVVVGVAVLSLLIIIFLMLFSIMLMLLL